MLQRPFLRLEEYLLVHLPVDVLLKLALVFVESIGCPVEHRLLQLWLVNHPQTVELLQAEQLCTHCHIQLVLNAVEAAEELLKVSKILNNEQFHRNAPDQLLLPSEIGLQRWVRVDQDSES